MALHGEGREYVRSRMPKMGMGTYQINDEETMFATLDAGLAAGYRMIDSAQLYGNEATIGEALNELLPKYKLKREDIFICSKLTPLSHGTELSEEAIEQSLDDLQTDYLDLLLIHWPGVCKMPGTYPFNPSLRHESYRVMEKYYDRGDVRAIGVSNFDERHLALLLKECRVLPAVNQCEFHPHFHPMEILNACKENDIHFQAYSSLGNEEYHKELSSDPLIARLASKYNVSIPVFLLSWSLSQGISVLPRSTNPDHMRENLKALDLRISQEDVNLLLNNGHSKKVCWDSSYIL